MPQVGFAVLLIQHSKQPLRRCFNANKQAMFCWLGYAVSTQTTKQAGNAGRQAMQASNAGRQCRQAMNAGRQCRQAMQAGLPMTMQADNDMQRQAYQ